MDKQFYINIFSDKKLNQEKLNSDKYINRQNAYIYNTIPQILNYFFIHCRVHLKIATRHRKFLVNRVDPCHFPSTTMIGCYFMIQVSYFHIYHKTVCTKKNGCDGRCYHKTRLTNSSYEFVSRVRDKLNHININEHKFITDISAHKKILIK